MIPGPEPAENRLRPGLSEMYALICFWSGLSHAICVAEIRLSELLAIPVRQ